MKVGGYLKNGEFYICSDFDELKDNFNDFAIIGEICDLECNSLCNFFYNGNCPFITKKMKNGDLIKFMEYLDMGTNIKIRLLDDHPTHHTPSVNDCR